MKKWKIVLSIVLVICLLGGVAAAILIPGGNSGKDTHLILNKNGSYGGSLSEEKYGKGAPLNGEYDVEDSPYYVVNNDFYNMPSTEERTIFPRFSSYQQTMQDSSGLACLMMILNYMGEDVKKEYTELALLNKYEELNGVEVYGNGTTEEGLAKLVESLNLGYTVEAKDESFAGTVTKESMRDLFKDCILEGKFVLVRYQSPVGYGWKVVIGYDDLGMVKNTKTGEESDSLGDDVIIFAEPYDGGDHCQDGYATERATDFFVWWRKMERNGKVTDKYSFLIIDPNLDLTYDLQPVDETVKQTLYDIHLPLNPDGTYGGTRNSELYGDIISGKGWYNHTESNYYKINDFYNMGSEGSRILLKNYTVLQQTMRSSCGICAVNSVLSYYGAEESQYDMELSYLDAYESMHNTTVKGKGSSTSLHFMLLREMGYEARAGMSAVGAEPEFSTLESYMELMRTNLEAGRPIVVSTNLGSGHFLTVIGVDTMGTDYIYDDIVITADSCDYWDSYQDGYNVFSAYKFFTQHTGGNYAKLNSYLVIYDKD